MAQHMDVAAPDPAEDQAGEELPLIELETLLNRPPSWRKRLTQLGLLLVTGIMLLVMFQGNSPLRKLAPPSDPQPNTLPPVLFINSNVNYGTVTINGKKQADTLPIVAAVHGDAFTIRLDAPPFRPISCHLRLSQLPPSGASAGGRDCFAFLNSSAEQEYQVNITMTLDDLPPAQQSQITAMLTRTLATERALTVPAGSYIATSFSQASTIITSQRVSAPLQASATVAPFAPWNPADDPLCVGIICPWMPPSGDIYTFSGHQWAITVKLALRWRFSSASGVAISDVVFQEGGVFDQIASPLNLSLFLNQAGNWTISQNPPTPDASNQLQDAFCVTGENILRQATGAGPHISMGITYDQGAPGCEVLVQVNNTGEGIFLWRFGVLLAANSRAHTMYPALPIAPPAEIAAVENP